MTLLLLVPLLVLQAPAQGSLQEQLWEAARTGNVAGITAALDKGADVNARARYGVTPLIYAATNGHLEAVRLLVSRKADVNVVDTFYRARAMDMALTNGHTAVAAFLLQNGSDGAETALAAGAQAGDRALVEAALTRDVPRASIEMALTMATASQRADLVPILKSALSSRPAAAAPPAFAANPATFPAYAGMYRDNATGLSISVTLQSETLMLQVQGQPALPLVPRAPATFGITAIPNFTATFSTAAAPAPSMEIVQGPVTMTLARAEAAAPAAAPPAPPPAVAAAPAVVPTAAAPRNWPAFRGDGASGNGDGQRAVSEWDVATGKNIKWKTDIPGISNASPIVWGTRVFVVTAISKAGDATFRTGAYGDVKPVDDLSEHDWRIYCLDKVTGKVLWQRSAFVGLPRVKRHTKGSQANSTPVTDGRRVVAAFGSPGLLVAWDMNGRQLWRVDLGTLDSGWFFDPTFQWGHASSPIIYGNTVVVQADIQKGSYLAAWDLDTGKLRWKTPRADEISTWGTPALVRTSGGREELVTNGTKVRGYDPRTGKLLWTLGPNSEVTVATPVAGHDLVFVTGGYPPVRPIYAIRPGATGDITLTQGQTTNAALAWTNNTEGTYIPTPLVYGDYLITMNNNGVVTAYQARTGERAFRGRVGAGGSFAASPVAADGRLFISSEDGEVYVVTAGPGLTEIAKNDMKEVIMATPAISDGVIVIRTLGRVWGIGK